MATTLALPKAAHVLLDRSLSAVSTPSVPNLCEYRVFGQWVGVVTVPKTTSVPELATYFARTGSRVTRSKAWEGASKHLRDCFATYALIRLRESCRQDGKVLPAGLRVFQALTDPVVLGEHPPQAIVEAWHEAMNIPGTHFLYLKPVWTPDGTPARVGDLRQERDEVVLRVGRSIKSAKRALARQARQTAERNEELRLLSFDPILTIVKGKLTPGKELHLIGWW